VESIIEIVWDELSLLFFCPTLGAINITLLALLPLIISFSVSDWLIVADIEDQIPSERGKYWEAGETRGVWGKIQVVAFVLRV
jgi:hypothetical protein